tara:strand:- start:364 stop:657 length:294 start_codon:yes stop_codon:yes gene_type:complete
MKKVIIIAAFIAGVSYTAEAQKQTNPTSTVEKIDNRTDEEKLGAYKSHLHALDSKEEWMRSNAEETRIGNEQGWFVKAAQTRKELKAKIATIENKKK